MCVYEVPQDAFEVLDGSQQHQIVQPVALHGERELLLAREWGPHLTHLKGEMGCILEVRCEVR